jgi:hypothetical protein
MIIKLNGRKASLYATAMAISLVALSGTAHAQSASNGKFKVIKSVTTPATTISKEGPGEAKPNALQPVFTPEQKIALEKKKFAATAVADAIAADTLAAYNGYKDALADSKLAVTDAAAKAKALTTAQAAKTAADEAAAAALAKKQTAVAELATAEALLGTAEDALADLQADPDATPAQIAAAQLAVAKAQAKVDLAEIAETTFSAAYTNAADAQADALTAYTDAIGADADAKALVLTTSGDEIVAKAAIDAELLVDTDFAAAVALWNGQSGSSYVASFDGIKAILADEALVVAATPVTYASNGYNRTVGQLTAAAASTNANIAMASGALTGSQAALDAGANFETEVLGALVDHETRITTNTTAIAALDVRTTANTTAISALDVRTTANTTAITALDTRTTANTTAIANEVTARVAADNALGARITTETNERIAADNVLRDQIASSTATAIAMGGAALLPDMGFTLSGNVAFYEGAQAMALNAAGKVGANAFVTASVGGALNKNGSVGGRLGFVLGF